MPESNRYKDLVAELTNEESATKKAESKLAPKKTKKSKARRKEKAPTARRQDDPKMARINTGVGIAKSKNPDYEKGTYYLPKKLTRKMRLHAAINQIEMSDLVSTAVTQYLLNNPVDPNAHY